MGEPKPEVIYRSFPNCIKLQVGGKLIVAYYFNTGLIDVTALDVKASELQIYLDNFKHYCYKKGHSIS